MTTTEHPLAHRASATKLIDLVTADIVWRRATPRQRALLRAHAAPLIKQIGNLIAQEVSPIRLERPVVQASARTLASMRAKGLVDEHNRLTADAIHAVLHTP